MAIDDDNLAEHYADVVFAPIVLTPEDEEKILALLNRSHRIDSEPPENPPQGQL